MESIEPQTNEPTKSARYGQPKIVDYGTLLELTQAAGTVNPRDLPHGSPMTAYPLS